MATTNLPQDLDNQREVFLDAAENLIPEEVKELIREVEKYAPPVPVFVDHSFVTTEGSCTYANAS